MSQQTTSNPEAQRGQEDVMAALFVQLILQQSNMAMMLLGKVAHPETGKVFHDLEAARMFIDQLEMLEAKTKGNLSKEESDLLKQTLMTLRFAFVQATEESAAGSKAAAQEEKQPEPAKQPSPEAQTTPATGATPAATSEEEHKKKFSKKY